MEWEVPGIQQHLAVGLEPILREDGREPRSCIAVESQHHVTPARFAVYAPIPVVSKSRAPCETGFTVHHDHFAVSPVIEPRPSVPTYGVIPSYLSSGVLKRT